MPGMLLSAQIFAEWIYTISSYLRFGYKKQMNLNAEFSISYVSKGNYENSNLDLYLIGHLVSMVLEVNAIWLQDLPLHYSLGFI